MITLTKIICRLFVKSAFILIAIISAFSVIDCQAAMPNRGESIRISGTVSHIVSGKGLARVVLTLEPKIDTGDRGTPKCEEALVNIKISTEEEGKRLSILYSIKVTE